MENYKRIMTGEFDFHEEAKGRDPQLTPVTEKELESSTDSFCEPLDRKKAKIETDKAQLKAVMGGDVFEKGYEYLTNARKADLDDPLIQKGLEKIARGSQAMMKHLI